MDYSDMQFEMLNIPRSQSLGNGTCCIRYFYRFINVLPDRDTMNSLVKQLDYKFTFSKEVYEISEDVDICAWVSIERLNDYEAIFILSKNEPDESVIFTYGINSLPAKIDKVFGTVESIEGDSRKMWIKTDWQY